MPHSKPGLGARCEASAPPPGASQTEGSEVEGKGSVEFLPWALKKEENISKKTLLPIGGIVSDANGPTLQHGMSSTQRVTIELRGIACYCFPGSFAWKGTSFLVEVHAYFNNETLMSSLFARGLAYL
uniref:Uncharacterized protein n=1 Tax=Vespula pensylvanica TaxID=30213 RepID=A0A834NWT6_VESPE|nr:hypothetical protein H0235_010307 [Vespula pensylvanica]